MTWGTASDFLDLAIIVRESETRSWDYSAGQGPRALRPFYLSCPPLEGSPSLGPLALTVGSDLAQPVAQQKGQDHGKEDRIGQV
jgi:hypothetical protein